MARKINYDNWSKEEHLREKSKKVKWWFKNGKQDAVYLAVPYVENKIDKPFYVDFIVMRADGKAGLFDTNGGIYAQTAGPRAEGLAAYIAAENKKGKKLYGGIVIKDKNSWRYNDAKKYIYNPQNLKSSQVFGVITICQCSVLPDKRKQWTIPNHS